jgi:chromosome segregation ATPase
MQTRLPGIMSISVALVRKLDTVAPELRDVLLELVDEIEQHREASVTKVEFNELKEIVRDLAQAQTLTGQRMEELAQAQVRTEQRMDSLAVRMEELAQAQARTEQRMDSLAVRMEELAQAQTRTEQRMEELAQAQTRTEAEVAKLAVSHGHLRGQVGGLAQTMAYALENDAYRRLPGYLSERCQLEVTQRLVRALINDEEINFYARARRGDEAVLIVGESVSRLDDASKLGQLHRKLAAVRAVESLPLVPLIVTHFAHPKLLAQAEQEGIIVVQSFEW